jgi:hypothetical protein
LKFKAPLSDSFVTDPHASGSEKLFHLSIAQRESIVEPNSMTYYGFRETVAFVICDLIIHSYILNEGATS